VDLVEQIVEDRAGFLTAAAASSVATAPRSSRARRISIVVQLVHGLEILVEVLVVLAVVDRVRGSGVGRRASGVGRRRGGRDGRQRRRRE
jgi:hypothetical protein